MGVWVSWWLSRWMVECGRGSGCSTCFVFFLLWTHGFAALSRPLKLPYTSFTVLLTHGGWWVDRFVGVSVVLRSAVLLSAGG